MSKTIITESETWKWFRWVALKKKLNGQLQITSFFLQEVLHAMLKKMSYFLFVQHAWQQNSAIDDYTNFYISKMFEMVRSTLLEFREFSVSPSLRLLPDVSTFQGQ